MKRKLHLILFLCGCLYTFGSTKKATVTEPVVVEITDATLSSIYYHQQNFAVPTKLVFTNLTSVEGYVYFHQNVNLMEVDFPQLTQTGSYFYFHQNLSLVKINAPNLNTVSRYLYVRGNTSLTELNLCGLTNILPDDNTPYYNIEQNTPAVDATPFCFSLGGPQNLALSSHSVAENAAVGTLVGTLSADSNYPNGTLTYTLPEFTADNNSFSIVGNQLYTHRVFDYETENEYTVHVVVRNQLGESTQSDFTINITNITNENLAVIEITDANLDNIYYHQQDFTVPTKLVFTNLTSVNGYVYFHQNTNLVEVDFPQLTQTGGYFYYHQNPSLVKIDAPNLHTVHDYLYVNGNTSLTELNVCGLTQIIASDPTNTSFTPYYYVNNNPLLDFDTTCLINTTITYTPADPIIVLPAPNTLLGTFSSDSTTPVTYYFVDANGNPTTNSNFIIIGNNLYLANEYNTYTESDFVINIGAIRAHADGKTSNGAFSLNDGLNEKIELQITFNIANAVLGVPTLNGSKDVAIFPNPAKDHITIQTDETIKGVQLFDVLGRSLNTVSFQGKAIDVSGVSNGNYILTVTTEEGKSYTKKIIIAH